jgi:threonine dehydrogenase-like Zn-dependent dehydrogenase
MKIAIIGAGPVGIKACEFFYGIGAELKLFGRNPPQEIAHYFKHAEVLRYHKQFLSQNESVTNRSRMADLFRVIYRSLGIDWNVVMQENADLYGKLDETVKKSLSTNLEQYEDFDVIVDCSGPFQNPLRLGPGGVLALNEKIYSQDENFYYGENAYKNLTKIIETKRLAIVGVPEIVNEYLSHFILQQFKGDKLFCITTSEIEKNLNLLDIETQYQSKCNEYAKNLHDWRDLEDYIKAKIPTPTVPERQWEFYSSHNVMSVDKMLDRTGIFLTIESPSFRIEESLKTLHVDAIVSLQGFGPSNLAQGLTHDEPGYFCIHHTDNITNELNQILKKLEIFFSKKI